jgi:hypothetical protein
MPRDASPIPAPVGLRPERHRAAPAAPTLAAAAPGTLPPAASESWPRVARRELLVALAPCLVLAAGISLAWPVTVDDAFISLRHARILVEHGELSFNADERVEGYSNFSEVLLAAALLDRGIEPLGVIKALCSVAALACVPLLYLLSRRLGATHAFALLGALLLALSTGLAFWSASGLETAFHTLLVTAGVLLFLRRRSRLDLLGAALLALAALTRVEAPVLVVAIAVARLLVERGEGRGWIAVARRNAPWLCLFGILYGVYFLWRFLYFGHLFPNPVYFKQAAGWEGLGESHTLNFVRSSWPLLLLAGASLREAGRRHWACLALVATALLVFLSARTLVLGDVSTMGFYDRYFVPVLPCLIAPAMLALSRAWSRSAAAPRERLAILGCAAALLLWQLASPGANVLHLAGRARSYPRAV